MSDPTRTDSSSGARTSRSVTFRTSLLRNLFVLILALALAILTVSMVGARKAVRTLCRDLVDSGTDRVETDLRRVFTPVPAVLHMFHDWSQSGLIDPEDPEQLNRLLVPVLQGIPQLVGISMGYSDGSGFMVARTPDGYRNQIVSAETTGRTSRWLTWETLESARKESVESDGYDPRLRPWYQVVAEDEEARANAVVRWTDPYPFFSTGAPGITASIRLPDKAGRLGVISVDLLLDDVSRLSETLEISPNGFLVVTTSDVRAIGLPRHPDLADPERRRAGFLKHPQDLGIPLFAEASRQIRSRFDLSPEEVMSVEFGLSEENRPFPWTFEGAGWWSYVRPCVIEEGPQFWIGVAVPEDDFLGELKEGRIYFFGLASLALIMAGFMSVRLSRRYSHSIERLIQQADRLRTLNTEPVPEESSEIVEIAQLHDAQERMRLALDSFARYVPSDVVRELLDKGEAAVIGGRHTSISILFTDVEGFTTISEQMSPDQLTAHMAEYFDAMIQIITDHHGTVDKLIGDAIVAFWSAPKVNEHHARDAVSSALQCHRELQKRNAIWESKGLPPLPTRFGVATGGVVVGNVGASHRLNYTALGDTVNLASRLEGANKFYGTRIIAAAGTVREAGEEYLWRKLDKVRVVGRSEPELIYELLGETSQVSPEEKTRAREYEQALQSYLDGDFEAARQVLQKLAEKDSTDVSVVRLAALTQKAIQEPPVASWDGVSEFQEK